MIYHAINYIVAAWASVMIVRALWRGSEFEKLWKRYKMKYKRKVTGG